MCSLSWFKESKTRSFLNNTNHASKARANNKVLFGFYSAGFNDSIRCWVNRLQERYGPSHFAVDNEWYYRIRID